MTASPDTAAALIGPWGGPCGGMPPFAAVRADTLEAAHSRAIELKRARVAAIVANADAPTFANTLEALEASGDELARAAGLVGVYGSTMAVGDMREAVQRMYAARAALDDEIDHNAVLFARIDAVWKGRAKLTPVQARLTEVVHERMTHRGAGLDPQKKAELTEINQELAGLIAKFNQNIMTAQETVATFLDDERLLDGVPAGIKAAAAALAEKRGRPGTWAIENTRPNVWPFLTNATNRAAREKIWRVWSARGGEEGPHNNVPVAKRILKLRGRKAQLMGYPNFATLMAAPRMARTPETAMTLMREVYDAILGTTKEQIADMQRLADAEGAGITIMPWDRLYYSEKLRRARFNLDAEAVKAYLDVHNVVNLMLDQASRLHGLTFTEMPEAPKTDPLVRVFAIDRGGEPVGAVWIDLHAREGKARGSFQHAIRSAESFEGKVLPLSIVCSALPPPDGDKPALIGWEYANVMFHEFGHALHMLLDQAPYRTLGAMGVPWDFIEVPALLNERWLYDREALRRHLRHNETGESIPDGMIDAVEAGLKFDRVFSVTLDYVAPAIVDMTLHMMADGRDIDPVAVEAQVFKELGVPEAVDFILRIPHAYHTFSEAYGGGLYVYLWADVMTADIGDAFAKAPGGFADQDVAARWRETMLTQGVTRPLDEAFRAFAGREPKLDALLRRFGLDRAA